MSSLEQGQLGVPTSARSHLAHAALQAIATEAHVDLLHIKGAATDPRVGRNRFRSSDADVLVRPTQVRAFLTALTCHGWKEVTSFASGSAFHHAANYFHQSWGMVDVHRIYPGFNAPDAFDILWQDRGTLEIAHSECTVPSLRAQRLILLLHVARNGRGTRDPDFERSWSGLDANERAAMETLVDCLHARTAFAAALGMLDAYETSPDHDLWEYFSTGNTSRVDEWKARYRAASGLDAKLRVLGQAIVPNRDVMAMELHREPTAWELLEAFFLRGLTALREFRKRGQ